MTGQKRRGAPSTQQPAAPDTAALKDLGRGDEIPRVEPRTQMMKALGAAVDREVDAGETSYGTALVIAFNAIIGRKVSEDHPALLIGERKFTQAVKAAEADPEILTMIEDDRVGAREVFEAMLDAGILEGTATETFLELVAEDISRETTLPNSPERTKTLLGQMVRMMHDLKPPE